MFEKLPPELFLEILSFCFFQDVFKLAKCNSKLYHVIKEYYYKILPGVYKNICDNVENNIKLNQFLLTNCNITYQNIDKFLMNRKSNHYIHSNMKDGIYYFSENVWKKSVGLHPYVIDHINEIYYNKYLVILKVNGTLFVCCYKNKFNGKLEKYNFINNGIQPYNQLFRIF